MQNPNLPNLIIKMNEDKDKVYSMVNFEGDLDKLGLESVRQQLDELVEKIQHKYLVLDFTDLNFINSESIGYIINLHYRLAKAEKHLVIVKASNYVKDVLQVIGVSDFIKNYQTLADFEESLR